jgi:hypothetical protein
VSIGLACIALAVAACNIHVDIYGLFRSSRGRTLSIYGEERLAKYLHTLRYVPENFDGVLMGSSVSDSIDTRFFRRYRLYNASINGGNVADMRPVAENLFSRRGYKLTIVCVHRFLTKDHDRKTDLMQPRQYWGALGSPQLLTAYVSRLAVKFGVFPNHYDERGTLHYMSGPDKRKSMRQIEQTVADIRRGTSPIGNYDIDPIALSDLDAVLTLARSKSDRVVVYFPPNPERILAIRKAEYAGYRAKIDRLLRPGDIVVDFNTPEYESLRSDYENFEDGVHTSRTGARLIAEELDRVVSAGGVEARAR